MKFTFPGFSEPIPALQPTFLEQQGHCSLLLVHFFEHGRWGSLVEAAIEGQSLTAEDQLFILMQAARYLSATRGLGSLEALLCHEPAESLCHSLNQPRAPVVSCNDCARLA